MSIEASIEPTVIPNAPDTILLCDVNIGTRFRKDYGDLSMIEDTVKEIGLIHPIVLRRNPDGSHDLMAGGRRTQALLNLGITTLHHGATCDPLKIGFVYKEEVSDDVLREIELNENIARKSMTWQEEVLLMAETHRLKKKRSALEGKKWGQRETGHLFGQSLGYINNILSVAELLEAKPRDEKVWSCEDIYGVIQIILSRKQDEAIKAKAADMKSKGHKDIFNLGGLPDSAPVATNESGLLTDIFLDKFITAKDASCSKNEQYEDRKERMAKTGDVLEIFKGDVGDTRADGAEGVVVSDSSDKNVEIENTIEIKISTLFQNANCRVLLPALPEESFDHIVTDPPYAIDMKNLGTFNDIDRIEETHDVLENLELLQWFVPEAFRVVKDGGWLVMWCDYMHFRQLHDWGIAAGFKVCRWPVVWHKTHQCRNSAPSFNPTKNTEITIWMRKGLATLRKPITTSVISAESATERRMYNNPFAKPAAVWNYIYEAIAYPGQFVYDPFCGEMSSCRAAVLSGLTAYGTELDEKHYNRGLEHMKTVYRSLTKSQVRFL